MPCSLGFIGCGNMARALLNGIRDGDTGMVRDVLCCDALADKAVDFAARYGAQATSLDEVLSVADYVVLAVKPQQSIDVLKRMAASRRRTGQKLISLAAGLSCATIEQILGSVPVVRVMPNTPALKGKGMAGICAGHYAGEDEVLFATSLLDMVGKTVVIDEAMMDALTAVSGSGPAYYFLIAEAMIEAAAGLGFEAGAARELVLQVMRGSLAMLEDGTDSPALLREKVSSPGGTTLAALHVLEHYDLRKAIEQAIKAAASRSQEIALELSADAGS
ncbi:MAG: pyrroline-5-carboxylate reductase [Syntrophomonadaceae bacterium]|nr:pyrroline-5-carboxylate reductase [Syntrophomonadaceae bacterium]